MDSAAETVAPKGSVLIVDDDRNIRAALRMILEFEGYDCAEAEFSGEAMNWVHERPFDLVITDMVLTEGDCTGLELIEMIARHDGTIPIILITGYPSVNRAVEAMKRGAVDFLVKPFDRDLLLHQADKALKERRLRLEIRRLQDEVNKAAVIEKLNRELNSKVGELTRLYAISEGLNELMDSGTLFERIAALAAEVTGARRVAVMLLDRKRQKLKVRAAVGPPEAQLATVVPVGEGIAGRVAQSGRLIRESRPARGDSRLALPLMIGEELFGVVKLSGKLDGSEFTREDEQIMQTLVEKAATKLENQALYDGLYDSLIDTLNALVTSIEAKDPYTRQHSQRVTAYAVGLGRVLGLDEDQLEMLGFAAMLHDIGKIGVRDELLTRTGKLTDAEYAKIKMHPVVGERIVKPLGLVGEERAIIRHHHERWDGLGYPDGLKGGEIPLLARIVAVADAFDAITSTRSYRRGRSSELALDEMRRWSGIQFDPRIIEALDEGLQSGVITVPEDALIPTCTAD